jgi:hypothetical protein
MKFDHPDSNKVLLHELQEQIANKQERRAKSKFRQREVDKV